MIITRNTLPKNYAHINISHIYGLITMVRGHSPFHSNNHNDNT